MSHGSGWCRQHVLDQHFCTISHTIVSAAVTHQVYNWFTSLKRFHISRTLLILFSHRACNACAEAMPIFTFIWKSVHTSTCNFHDFHQTDAFLGHAIFFFASNHIFHSFNVFLCLMAEERYRTIMKPPTHTTRELSWFRRHGHRHWCHRYAGKTLGSLHKSMRQHLAAMLFYQSFLHAGVIRVAVFTGTTAIVSLAPHPGYPPHGCMPRLPHLVWNPNMQ